MQALRHASRRALHASVMQKTFDAAVKAYSVEAASPLGARKTKEDRIELAKQFVAKFKAANNGQLPGITLLRKEVGGKYETLKEVLQDLTKDQEEPDTTKQTVELKDAVVKDGIRKKSPLKESSEKDKKGMPQISKGVKALYSVDPGTTSEDKQSVIPVKNASKLIKTGFISDDDDDSDVAAPEYHHSPSVQKASLKMDEDVKVANPKGKVLEQNLVAHLKNDSKKQSDTQIRKSKHADIKQPEADIKQPKVEDGGIKIQLPPKAQDAVSAVVQLMDDTAAEHLSADGSFGKSLGLIPLTTVVRVVNLPQHITASKLRAVCENVGRVHKVEIRRGHNADIHFDADLQEMGSIYNRFRKLSIGPFKLRAFPAQKFSCGNDVNSKFQPQDIRHYRQVRNILFSSFEQKFKYLSWQLEDYRELQELKLAS